MKKYFGILSLFIVLTITSFGCDDSNNEKSNNIHHLQGSWNVIFSDNSLNTTISLSHLQDILLQNQLIEAYWGNCTIKGESFTVSGSCIQDNSQFHVQLLIYQSSDGEDDEICLDGILEDKTITGTYEGWGEYGEDGSKEINDGTFTATLQ